MGARPESDLGGILPEQKAIDKAVSRARLAYRIETEAKLRMLYAEQALATAKAGLNSLYEEYTALAEEARVRHDNLKARAEEQSG